MYFEDKYRFKSTTNNWKSGPVSATQTVHPQEIP